MSGAEAPENSRVSRRTVQIEWGDCDPAGIVWFPRYFEKFDACTHAAFEAAGLPKPLMLRKFGIFGIPLVDAHGKFIAPCSFGDEVVIETRITQWRRSSFRVHHRLLKGSLLAVEGFEVRVWTGRDSSDPSRLRALPIPQEVMDLFRASA